MPPMDSLPAPPTAADLYTTTATNFSFSLYRDLSSSVEGNLLTSTFSVHLLLLLLTVGSKSKTNDDLTTLLRLPKNKTPNFDKIKDVIEKIEVPECLTVANGIFPNKEFDLSLDFENQAREYLKSEVKKLDFAGNPTVGESEINEWAKNKTNGKISKIFDSGVITENTVMVLASAVHFQNKWKNQFKEVKNEKFCLDDKNRVDIEMMHQTKYYDYYKDEQNQFAAVKIPYEFGGFDMLVILPDKMDGLKDLERQFFSDSTKFPLLLANLTIHNVVLSLPKFGFESDLNLKESMTNLGCGDMFLPGADFSKMSSSGMTNLRIDQMKHKTYIKVNEIGTEAAAITAVSFVKYSASFYSPDIKTVTFHACHPFLFFIKKGDNIIFTGRFAKPST